MNRMAFSFDLFNDDFFKDMLNLEMAQQDFTEKSCPHCGMTMGMFERLGRFGCSRCYDTFAPEIARLVKRLQGSAQYAGRVPERTSGDLKVKRQITLLRHNLEQAVRDEQFEEAVVLRDKIRALEQELLCLKEKSVEVIRGSGSKDNQRLAGGTDSKA